MGDAQTSPGGSPPAGGAVEPCPLAAKAWLSFELVGENGAPVPNERYRLTFADGSVLEAALSEHGLAVHKQLEPAKVGGPCRVSFPGLEPVIWHPAKSEDQRRGEAPVEPRTATRFVRRGWPEPARLRLLADGVPLANAACKVKPEESPEQGASTDDKGVLSWPMPPAGEKLEIRFGERGWGAPLRVAALAAPETPKGAQERLNNLGFFCGRADGEVDEGTHAAVRAFQSRLRLAVTGELDAPTATAIAEVFEGKRDLPPFQLQISP